MTNKFIAVSIVLFLSFCSLAPISQAAPSLFKAIQSRNYEEINSLLKQGANVDGKNIDGSTALHLAAEDGQTETIKILIEAGANIHARDLRQETPLHSAAARGKSEAVRLLLEKKANPDAVNKFGNTPLHLSAGNGYSETTKILIEAGASVNAADDREHTPLDYVIFRTKSEEKTELINLLMSKGTQITAENLGKAMQIAITFNDPATAKMLIEAGANTHVEDNCKNTPLHSAAMRGMTELVQRLIEKKANVNAADADGKTPIHEAEKNGHTDCVKRLIEAGAKPCERKREKVDTTPWDVIEKNVKFHGKG